MIFSCQKTAKCCCPTQFCCWSPNDTLLNQVAREAKFKILSERLQRNTQQPNLGLLLGKYYVGR